MHATEHFLAEIREHRYDDGPRLIYADWLDECYDVMGEFIRLQCAGRQLATRADRQRAARRADELSERYRRQWIGRHFRDEYQLRFQRGFPEHAIVSDRCFASESGRSVLKTRMLLDLTISSSSYYGRYADATVESLELAHYVAELDSLRIASTGLGLWHIKKLARIDGLRRLRKLALPWNPAINADCLQELAESTFIERLEHLELEGIALNAPMIETLLERDAFARLQTLVVTRPRQNRIARHCKWLQEKFGNRVYFR